MPIKRTTHWATRELDQHLRSVATTPFAWGTHDCCMFPANAIKAFTGFDLAMDFRGKYHDLPTAMAAIKAIAGGTTVADAVAWCAQRHGLPELKHPLMAQRGDLVVMTQAATGPDAAFGAEIAGIVHLTGRHLVTVGQDGLIKLPITAVKRAWRV